AGADAAEALAFDGLVQLERAAPERLVAERVEAEDPLPFLDHSSGVLTDAVVEGGRSIRLAGAGGRRENDTKAHGRAGNGDTPSDGWAHRLILPGHHAHGAVPGALFMREPGRRKGDRRRVCNETPGR